MNSRTTTDRESDERRAVGHENPALMAVNFLTLSFSANPPRSLLILNEKKEESV